MRRIQSEVSGVRPLHRAADTDIYYFDIVHDYPAIGGVVEFSRTLFQSLKQHYGNRLVSARDVARGLGLTDVSMPYLHRERLVAERLARLYPNATFFFPNFQSPVPGHARAGGPRVVNVLHDVQFAYLPELFSHERLAALHRTFAETRENADEIIFISESARAQFLDTIGEPRQHRVIYNPIDVGPGGTRSVAVARQPYLLASVHYHPHKNFAGLLAFFAQLAANDPGLELVITGHGGARIARLIADLPDGARSRVHHLGYVSRRRLDGLYRRARAFVSLSHFEGFNMSAAEAALHGAPLLLSDIPVHRELFSGQACFLDPLTPSLADAEAFLARRARESSPEWPFRETCRPERVGAAYARALEEGKIRLDPPPTWRASPRRTAGRSQRAGMGPFGAGPVGAGSVTADGACRAIVRRGAAALLAATILSGGCLFGTGLLGAGPALADGGAGGGKGARMRVDNA